MTPTLKNSSRLLALFAVFVFLAAVFILYKAILIKTGGHFVYALDDPYIHLALAENLAHGHYGINPAEFTSPSSSVLWPFLLIPFAGTPLNACLPLLWNIFFGTIAAALLGLHVARWPLQPDGDRTMQRCQQALTVLLLLFVANLVSLTFVGMEHVLQVLLAICCALGIAETLRDRPVPFWCLAAAVVAPSVRYENLTLTLAVAVVLIGLGAWKRAAAVFGLSLVPLVAFSAFLHSKGLPLLPLSVLVKGNAYASSGIVSRLVSTVKSAVIGATTDSEHYPIVILFLIFAGLAWRATHRAHRFVFAAAALVGGLQLLIGRFGWFHRYEIYATIFLVLLWICALSERPRSMLGSFWMALVFCSSVSIYYTLHTAGAAREIYSQQYQMHRFVTDFYHGDYAVGDLGLVSYQRTPNTYVLDVVGLASPEASRETNKTAAWLDGMVQRRNIRLAILNPDWFSIPQSWVPLARMCLPHIPFAVAEQCIVFYSTVSLAPTQASGLHNLLERFAVGLPPSAGLSFAEPRSDGTAGFPLVSSHN